MVTLGKNPYGPFTDSSSFSKWPHNANSFNTMHAPEPKGNREQELVNATLHGFGTVFGIVGIPILIAFAVKDDHVPGIVGAAIYGFCFLQLFTSSTLYHAFRHQRTERVFGILDNVSIFFLMAGTYTPFLLIYVNDAFGISLLSVLWGLTALGIIFKIFFTGQWRIVSTLVYIVMGCIMIVGGRAFFENIPWSVLIMIFIGGALYLLGVIFYLWKKDTYHHAVWHFLVLAAAICHYIAVLMSV